MFPLNCFVLAISGSPIDFIDEACASQLHMLSLAFARAGCSSGDVIYILETRPSEDDTVPANFSE